MKIEIFEDLLNQLHFEKDAAIEVIKDFVRDNTNYIDNVIRLLLHPEERKNVDDIDINALIKSIANSRYYNEVKLNKIINYNNTTSVVEVSIDFTTYKYYTSKETADSNPEDYYTYPTKDRTYLVKGERTKNYTIHHHIYDYEKIFK